MQASEGWYGTGYAKEGDAQNVEFVGTTA